MRRRRLKPFSTEPLIRRGEICPRHSRYRAPKSTARTDRSQRAPQPETGAADKRAGTVAMAPLNCKFVPPPQQKPAKLRHHRPQRRAAGREPYGSRLKRNSASCPARKSKLRLETGGLAPFRFKPRRADAQPLAGRPELRDFAGFWLADLAASEQFIRIPQPARRSQSWRHLGATGSPDIYSLLRSHPGASVHGGSWRTWGNHC